MPESVDDLFRYSFAKIFLVGIGALVGEWQHGDGAERVGTSRRFRLEEKGEIARRLETLPGLFFQEYGRVE